MGRRPITAVLAAGIVGMAAIAGWYAYQGANYVTTDYASVVAPTRWVSAPIFGEVTALKVSGGRPVRKGQVVAIIQNPGTGRHPVTAGVSGWVGPVAVNAGDVVQPGQALFAIVELGHEVVEANIPETSAGQIVVGETANVRFPAYPGTVFSGKVATIGGASRSLDNPLLGTGAFAKSTQWIPVIISVSAPGAVLRAGESASVQIVR